MKKIKITGKEANKESCFIETNRYFDNYEEVDADDQHNWCLLAIAFELQQLNKTMESIKNVVAFHVHG